MSRSRGASLDRRQPGNEFPPSSVETAKLSATVVIPSSYQSEEACPPLWFTFPFPAIPTRRRIDADRLILGRKQKHKRNKRKNNYLEERGIKLERPLENDHLTRNRAASFFAQLRNIFLSEDLSFRRERSADKFE